MQMTWPSLSMLLPLSKLYCYLSCSQYVCVCVHACMHMHVTTVIYHLNNALHLPSTMHISVYWTRYWSTFYCTQHWAGHVKDSTFSAKGSPT